METPQLALANLGAGVRPNLLDNAFFRVNQRGNAAYQAPSSTIYACDRFKISHGTVTSLENGVEVSAADENVYFIQYFEQAFDTFAGQELTISALTPNGLFAASGLVPEPEPSGNQVYFRVNLGNGWELSLEYGGVSKRLIWAVRASAGLPSAPLQILAAKAEFGPAQTLAYQDDDGAWQLLPQSDMDYGTQLFRCQRYQIPLDGTSRYPIVQIVDANTLLIFIPLPVTMRTAPALSDPDGKLIIYDQIGAAQTDFAFDVAAFCSNGIMLRAQKVNHGITGGFLYVNATTGVDAPFLVANL